MKLVTVVLGLGCVTGFVAAFASARLSKRLEEKLKSVEMDLAESLTVLENHKNNLARIYPKLKRMVNNTPIEEYDVLKKAVESTHELLSDIYTGIQNLGDTNEASEDDAVEEDEIEEKKPAKVPLKKGKKTRSLQELIEKAEEASLNDAN